MSQSADLQDTSAGATHPLLAPIQHELTRVERLLRRQLRSDAPFVDQLLRYGSVLGGKRLRPALLLLAGKASGELVDEHFVLAAVVEMIHTATLVHDDVLDEATLRRHGPTVNARWDNQASVLLGDYLFTHAFRLASTTDIYACRTIGHATNIVCEGELRQIGHRGDFRLTEPEYLDIIEAKTAALCACSCRLGAHYAGATPQIEDRLARFGRALGIAYQVVDDLLDVKGDEATVGKSLGTDLQKRKPTLPLIYVLRCASPTQRDQLICLVETENDEALLRQELNIWFERFGAVDYSRQRAAEFIAQAREEIKPLPDTAAKVVLQQMTEFIIRRAH